MAQNGKTVRPPFEYETALRLAEEIFLAPPVRKHSRRPNDLRWGVRIARFAIPLELCLSSNVTGRAGFASSKFAHASIKDKIWFHMEDQAKKQQNYLNALNLPIAPAFRPRIHCVKFSSGSADACANWAKAALDMLTVPRRLDKKDPSKMTKRRLSIITDDRDSAANPIHWEEFLPRKHHPFVLLEVRSELWADP